MTTLVITYTDDGQITGWRYESDDGYEPDPSELAVDPSTIDHRAIRRKIVDTSVSPPELVDNPDWHQPPSTPELARVFAEVPIRRDAVSGETKTAFRDARDAGDLQTQLDILFEVMTGEVP